MQVKLLVELLVEKLKGKFENDGKTHSSSKSPLDWKVKTQKYLESPTEEYDTMIYFHLVGSKNDLFLWLPYAIRKGPVKLRLLTILLSNESIYLHRM